tara:strand:+ start:1485 stop:2006 length:522 start_codon:yes stop_codon:yes gene_type:complete
MEIIDDFARFYPAATLIYALIINDIYLFIFMVISNLVNGVLKYKIAKPIMGDKNYPILGKGTRPKGAANCGIWKDPPGHVTKSYGMPSGHSQEAWGFATYMILKNMSYGYALFDIRNVILSGLAIFIAYSRVYLNCHTVQQVIIGGMIGILFGSIGFNMKTPIVSYLTKVFKF